MPKSSWKVFEVTIESRSAFTYRVKARSRDEVMNMEDIEERGSLVGEHHEPGEIDYNDIWEVKPQ